MNLIRKIRSDLALFLVIFAAQTSCGYEVWFGLPYIPKGSHDELKDQWDIVAEKLEGMNTNNVDAQRASADKNTAAEWKAIVQCMPTAKTNAVLEFPRTHFQYDGFGGAGKETLPEALVTKFRKETRLGCQIRWVMAFDNQPGEDRNLPVEEWSDSDLQNLRDWLDNNGHADVKIITTVRNNGTRSRSFSRKAIVEGVSIEAKAELWFENSGSRQDYLLWALSEPLVKDKHFKFQVPFNRNGNDSGYQGMREFMRWLSTPAMLGSTDFIRRDDVAFMVISYSDIFPHLPETSADGTQYEDTLFSTALSIIEQRDLFEGRGPGGLISLEQALSRDRLENTATPVTGLVAHWPLDEGSGTSTTDASGFGSDAALLNGASWGSDATRSSYVVFDGTNDRIATAFTYALAGPDQFTWAWWAKKDPTSHASSIMVGNRYGGTGSESLEFIKFMPSKASFANTSSSTTIEDSNYADLPSNEWHHYAMVKNGTSCQWYVDGVAQGPPVTINYNETSPIPLLVGGDDDGSGTKVNEHFKGAIDDVVLYRSALSAAEVTDVMGGSYALTIPMAAAALGSPANLIDGSTWADGLPPHAGYNYLVPNTGNLRGASGTSIFPGYSLTVAAGGRFQVRAIGESAELTTVNHLILKGGTSFVAGGFAEVAAGTGSSSTNVLDGTITNSGHTRFLSFGNSGGSTIARSLKVLAWIGGSGRIQAMEGSAARLSSITIANSANTFSGTWEVAAGSTLIFDKAGAVGGAAVEVAAGGVLEVKGNWSTSASLAVSNLPNTAIKVGSYGWKISSLKLGAATVPDGVYTVGELNSLAGSSVFIGNGTLIVGVGLPGGPVAHWRLDEGAGTTAIDSSGGGNAGTLLHGAHWGSDGTRASFASFDGTDDRISTTFSYALASSDDFTWTWWAKADAGASSGSIMVGNRYDGGGTESLEFIKFTPQKATFVNGGLDDREDYNYADITNNGWHHYAMVKVGASYQWYVDGVAQGVPVVPINYSESDVIPLNIGGDDDEASPGGREGEHFKGSIDDVALYGRALMQSEIASVFNGVYGNFPETTVQEDWRQLHFGMTANTGIAADGYDANFDGESNLLEFATGQDPHARTLLSTPLTLNGGNLEFRYSRSSAALAEGVIFTVEWSDTLLPDSWGSVGVTEMTDTEMTDTGSPGTSEVENRIATIPAGNTGRRFIHLKISTP